MSTAKYWELRLEDCREALEKNNFSAFIVQTPADAKTIFIDSIWPELDVTSVSLGDSMTLYETDILPYFREKPEITLIETFGENIPRTISMQRRHEAISVDLFFLEACRVR